MLADWNAMWRAGQQHRKKMRGNVQAWDRRAKEFQRATSSEKYAGQVVRMMNPQSHWTVLDMGCASGTLAVPLASRVASVTAADPSSEMRRLLQQRCSDEGIENIRICPAGWEDDWEEQGIGVHDVVLGSRSLMTDDLEKLVRKAHSYARELVVLGTLAGNGPHDPRIIRAVGREFHQGPDYMIVLNLLRELGIFARVDFTITQPQQIFADLDTAVRELRWMVRDLQEDEEARLRRWLADQLRPVEGGVFLPDRAPVRWAVITWNPSEFSEL